jgi:hypothetical protein
MSSEVDWQSWLIFAGERKRREQLAGHNILVETIEAYPRRNWAISKLRRIE